MTLQPGDRVAWILDPDDPTDEDDGWRGTIREPTQDELDYIATWSPTARAAVKRHVLIAWDGNERWDRAWAHPDDLRPAP